MRPGGAALAAGREVIQFVQDIRRVEKAVIQGMVVTPDLVKDETEVGVGRCGGG